ncbi:MAG: helix-turn-helix domain-containing protein [Deltaproteobacteria bacterium]|nr:helix-turn-helix domain-containing protein [Deltaproteobacteria bacterium]
MGYPSSLETWGDRLRKKRIDAKLSQKAVACLLGADEASVNNWETRKASPSIAFLPKIIAFLGYMPYEPRPRTIGERIRIFREVLGASQAQLADYLQVDISTLGRWEMNRRKPASKYLDRLSEFFARDEKAGLPQSPH